MTAAPRLRGHLTGLATRLLLGCWFGHAHMVRERRKRVYVLVCPRCGASRPFLSKQTLKVRPEGKIVKFPRKQARIS